MIYIFNSLFDAFDPIGPYNYLENAVTGDEDPDTFFTYFGDNEKIQNALKGKKYLKFLSNFTKWKKANASLFKKHGADIFTGNYTGNWAQGKLKS